MNFEEQHVFTKAFIINLEGLKHIYLNPKNIGNGRLGIRWNNSGKFVGVAT